MALKEIKGYQSSKSPSLDQAGNSFDKAPQGLGSGLTYRMEVRLGLTFRPIKLGQGLCFRKCSLTITKVEHKAK